MIASPRSPTCGSALRPIHPWSLGIHPTYARVSITHSRRRLLARMILRRAVPGRAACHSHEGWVASPGGSARRGVCGDGCAADRLLRRQGHFAGLVPQLVLALESARADADGDGDEHAIADDELRLMFSCCDPALAPPAQVAVILKYLCGFSLQEIAQAFLSSDAAAEKQLFRSRRTLEER